MVWTNRGALYNRRWQEDRAADLLSRALDLWDHLPAAAAAKRENRWGRVQTLWELGKAYNKQGRLADALRRYEQAHDLCRQLGREDAAPEIRVVEAATGLVVIRLLEYSGRSQEARGR